MYSIRYCTGYVAWPTHSHIIDTNKCKQATHVNRSRVLCHQSPVSGVFRVSALSCMHSSMQSSNSASSSRFRYTDSIFDGSLAQFHLHSSYSLTWCAYGSRRCFYGYGYTGACNSSGTRIINVGCVKDLRARHLASTDAAITRRRSCTHQGPNCVCSPTCCRG